MRRVLAIGVFVTSLWMLVFIVVWRSTGITDRPCDDNVTIPVAAACVAPAPSVFPALPIATAAAAVVGIGAGRGRRSDRGPEPDGPHATA